MSDKSQRRKGVVSELYDEDSSKTFDDSLDWDSPSAKTGTVKKRPLSSDSFVEFLNSQWKNTQDIPSFTDKNQIKLSDKKICNNQASKIQIKQNLVINFPKGGKQESSDHVENHLLEKECTETQFRENCFGELAFHRENTSRRISAVRKMTPGDVFKQPASITHPQSCMGKESEKDNIGINTPIPTSRRIKVLGPGDVSKTRTRSLHDASLNKYKLHKENGINSADSTRNTIFVCLPSKIPLNKRSKDVVLSRPSDFNNPKKENQTTVQEKQEKGHLRNLTKLNYPFHPSDRALPLENRGKCEKYKKIPNINADFPQEKEILIETNGLRKRENSGSFREGTGSLQDHNATQTGKVSSDTDSGIASPLSPGSVYGFLGHLDKVNGFPKKLSLGHGGRDDVLRKKNCWCEGERVQVSECVYLWDCI